MTGTRNQIRPYPVELESKIKSLWEAGYSSGAIGGILNLTRNQVIGKVWRMKLEKRRTVKQSPRARGGAAKPNWAAPKKNKTFNFGAPKAPKPERVAPTPQKLDMIVPIDGVGISILDATSDHCHAVVRMHDRAAGAFARYCGHPVMEGESYCANHYVVFHQPPRPRKASYTPYLGPR